MECNKFDINQQKQNRISDISKSKKVELKFELNIGSSFTKMSFIQRKAINIILKRARW